MTTVADSLDAWGILRAPDVVDIARAVGLELAAAAALLEQESAGGRNVWGSDAVSTGGAYVKGAEVTHATYAAYRLALKDRRAGQQGVGPCQLTSVGFQDQADRLGGCWVPTANMRVGFLLLAGYITRWGVLDAFRAYNGGAGNRVPGSNANADRYSAQAVAKLGRWRTRLGTTTSSIPIPAPPRAVPTPEDDMLPDERAVLLDVQAMLRKLKPGVMLPGRSVDLSKRVDDHFGWSMTGAGRADDAARGVDALKAELAELSAKVATPTVPTIEIDYVKLAAALFAVSTGKVTL